MPCRRFAILLASRQGCRCPRRRAVQSVRFRSGIRGRVLVGFCSAHVLAQFRLRRGMKFIPIGMVREPYRVPRSPAVLSKTRNKNSINFDTIPSHKLRSPRLRETDALTTAPVACEARGNRAARNKKTTKPSHPCAATNRAFFTACPRRRPVRRLVSRAVGRLARALLGGCRRDASRKSAAGSRQAVAQSSPRKPCRTSEDWQIPKYRVA